MPESRGSTWAVAIPTRVSPGAGCGGSAQREERTAGERDAADREQHRPKPGRNLEPSREANAFEIEPLCEPGQLD